MAARPRSIFLFSRPPPPSFDCHGHVDTPLSRIFALLGQHGCPLAAEGVRVSCSLHQPVTVIVGRLPSSYRAVDRFGVHKQRSGLSCEAAIRLTCWRIQLISNPTSSVAKLPDPYPPGWLLLFWWRMGRSFFGWRHYHVTAQLPPCRGCGGRD